MNIITPQLPEELKTTKINMALLHEAVEARLSGRRRATAHTKTRSEVSGGGKKPWRQKGTGRARVGSSRNPAWKGGGVTFGPRNERNYKKEMTRKKKKAAALTALALRIKEDNLKIVDDINLPEPKTRAAVKSLREIFEDMEKHKILVLVNGDARDIFRSFRNISNVTVSDWKDINSYMLLEHEKILFSKQAWEGFLGSKGIA
jgi:large subunit ribosomal protein L4